MDSIPIQIAAPLALGVFVAVAKISHKPFLQIASYGATGLYMAFFQ
jgi:hypothetical protein